MTYGTDMKRRIGHLSHTGSDTPAGTGVAKDAVIAAVAGGALLMAALLGPMLL